jgi:hypothetical protein
MKPRIWLNLGRYTDGYFESVLIKLMIIYHLCANSMDMDIEHGTGIGYCVNFQS